jgi:hypothetical protein
MRDGTYRVLISLIAVWGALHIPTVLSVLLLDRPHSILETRYYLAPVALAVLPIAVVGICMVQRWGFVLMGVATLLAFASYPPLASFPCLIFLFVLLRFWMSRNERLSPKAAAEPAAAPDRGSRPE